MKKSWAEGKIVSNNFSCNTSKIEKEFKKDVEKICGYKLPKKTIRLKDGTYFFPDVLIEELGLVIEFYGDYWHANPQKFNADDIIHYGSSAQKIWEKDKERINKMQSALVDNNDNHIDYRVKIIWEHEYINSKESTLNNLDLLINWDTCSF
jgi:G:T-mismatch repair DNA endonuclease (very short patch repair protein)